MHFKEQCLSNVKKGVEFSIYITILWCSDGHVVPKSIQKLCKATWVNSKALFIQKILGVVECRVTISWTN